MWRGKMITFGEIRSQLTLRFKVPSDTHREKLVL